MTDPEAPLQPADEQQRQSDADNRQQQRQQDELPERRFRVGGEDAEVHAEVACEERQRQEDRRDDRQGVDDLRLPAGDEFGVVAESVLGLLADVPGVLLHPGYAPPVTIEILLRTWAHARQRVYHLGDVLKVVGIPPEFLDAAGEKAENLDELA